jgi:hypothetical protein
MMWPEDEPPLDVALLEGVDEDEGDSSLEDDGWVGGEIEGLPEALPVEPLIPPIYLASILGAVSDTFGQTTRSAQGAASAIGHVYNSRTPAELFWRSGSLSVAAGSMVGSALYQTAILAAAGTASGYRGVRAVAQSQDLAAAVQGTHRAVEQLRNSEAAEALIEGSSRMARMAVREASLSSRAVQRSVANLRRPTQSPVELVDFKEAWEASQE